MNSVAIGPTRNKHYFITKGWIATFRHVSYKKGIAKKFKIFISEIPGLEVEDETDVLDLDESGATTSATDITTLLGIFVIIVVR